MAEAQLALDYETLLENRIWQILEGRPQWAALVEPGNRIKINGLDPTPLKTTWSEGDFPECIVWVTDGQSALSTGQQTYAAPTKFHIAEKSQINIELTHKGTRKIVANQLVAETRAAILKAGRTLGLTLPANCTVDPVGPMIWSYRIVSGRDGMGNAGGSQRLKTILSLGVPMRLLSTAIVPE